MKTLYVLYDETCGFCCRCVEWLGAQPVYVPLVCLPAGAASTRELFPTLRREGKQELTAVDERGGVYREADAWIAVLWALRGYRGWARRLSAPALRPLARNVFQFVSQNRHKVSTWFGLQPDAYVARTLVDRYGAPGAPRCEDQRCEVPTALCQSCRTSVPEGREYCPVCLATLEHAQPA